MSHGGWDTESGSQCSSWWKGSHMGPTYPQNNSDTSPHWAGLWVLPLVGVGIVRVRRGWGPPTSQPSFPHQPSGPAASTHTPRGTFLQSGTSLVSATSFQPLKTFSKEQWTAPLGGVGPKLLLCPKQTFRLNPKCSLINSTKISRGPTVCQVLSWRRNTDHTGKSPPSKTPASKSDEKVRLVFQVLRCCGVLQKSRTVACRFSTIWLICRVFLETWNT